MYVSSEWSSSPVNMFASSIPRLIQSNFKFSESYSVVIWVVKARFLTKPHCSPSGVSLGQRIPHWDGCRVLGPAVFLVFSKLEFIFVIVPKQLMYDCQLKTWDMPYQSILNHAILQFPVEIAFAIGSVIISHAKTFRASNSIPFHQHFGSSQVIALFKSST